MSRLVLLPLAILTVLAGCDAKVERFEPNEVFAQSLAYSRQTPVEPAVNDVRVVMEELFGTPNEPRWPAELIEEERGKRLVDPERLARAAGPVFSGRDGEHGGLYREHCVPCHGLSGSGAGPTSRFQDPYPRDFRHGVFKWKRTERGAKPTREDLVTVLRRGVPGTAMPSFQLMPMEDLESVTDYLVYLAVRGEVERQLLAVAVDELGYEDQAPEDDLRLIGFEQVAPQDRSEGQHVVVDVLGEVVAEWVEAEQHIVAVPPFPESNESPPPTDGGGTEELRTLADSIARGRELFRGKIANCAGCHGPDGTGQVPTLDYDDWTKDYSSRIGLTPTDSEAMQVMREAGALPPRPIRPRNLRDGVFRGGGDPATLFRRITQGIAGTPMPGVEWTEEESGKGLTTEQIWDLVRYVRSLSEGSQAQLADRG